MEESDPLDTSGTAGPFSEKPLSAEEIRVLGSLIEKQATTPEIYPLTVNALAAACNQKTSREPVMNLEPGQVARALRQLEGRGLVRLQMSARADRWEQTADRKLELIPAQLILFGLLLLRGPQTTGELLARSTRMHRFEGVEQVQYQIERLASRGLAVQLPRRAGQRELRYMHLAGGPVEPSLAEPARSARAGDAPDTLVRIEQLEARVAALEARLARLDVE